jgi:polyribonucleotide nucleotidyltransferase
VKAAAGEDAMRKAYRDRDKQERTQAIAAAKDAIKAGLSEEQLADSNLGTALKKLESSVLRGDVVKHGNRIDGRALDRDPAHRLRDRPSAAHPWLGPVHPGRNAGLVVTTLGTGDDEQFIDALHGNFKSNFLLHYNFPPYSVGEVGRVGPPGRREIGHGKLAWRALQAVLPALDRFPLHDPSGVGDHGIQRLVLDGVGLRFVVGDDGCGRAAQGAGGRCRHGPDPRG